VSACPETIPYNSFEYNYVNFTEQEYGITLESQYKSTELKSPKFILGNYCYESCPSNSVVDGLSYQCQCSEAWHKDIITNEIECYKEDYCKYDGYKYYISDTKECASSCPSGYYQFNFQCYSDGCPSDTTESESNKCESNYFYKFFSYLYLLL